MSLPAHTQVLIVGAGPVGMACALTLVHLGLHVTLIDAFPGNKNGSRAMAIHAQTLEVLNTVGLANPLLEAGIQAKGIGYFRGGKKLLEVDVSQLRDETEYPVVLLIPQHEVERILREKLAEAGVNILRPHTVVDIKEDVSGGGLEVTFDDGSCVHSQFVIGADGSRSTVRRLANIDFKDPSTGIDYDSKMLQASIPQIALADVYFDETLPTKLSHDTGSFDFENSVFMAPLRTPEEKQGQGVSFWRIGLWMVPGALPIPRTPDIEFFQAELDRRRPFNAKFRLASVENASRYRVRFAVASTMFQKMGEGNILLVGDAAHVHSPVGGQGLNLGLCDAVALGNAVHAHIQANSKADVSGPPDHILIEYSATRRKLALKVVGMTQSATTVMSGKGLWRVFRDVVLWMVGRFPMLRKAAARSLAGLNNRTP